MTYKELQKRLNPIEYYYVVYPDKRYCVEFNNIENSKGYIAAFGGELYDHFPYADFGYDDPYTFTEEWEVFNTQGKIEYDFDSSGNIMEVCGGTI